MYDDVLIPTDGSEAVRETLTHALPIAESNGATVHALYVVDTRITNAADRENRGDLEETLEADGDAAVAEVAEEAAAAGLETETAVREGTPAKGILAYADAVDADLIVVGSHGKSPREKITSLGSVSERVVDDASIPVLVVRESDGD